MFGFRSLLKTCCIGVLMAGLSACGSDDGKETTTSTASTPAVTTATSTTPTSISSVSVPPTDATSYLTDVKVAATPTSETVTFTFSNAVPGYAVSYIDTPLLSDGEGKPVSVAGGAVVEVRFVLASGVNLTGGAMQTYTGPKRFSPPDTTIVKEVVQSGDFESHLSWGIGTSTKVPFTVASTQNPYTVVITFTKP